MIAALTFAQLLHRCAPNIGPRTMTAIVRVESDGQALAIHDNTLRRTFVPHDANQGVAWATQLLALHHSVDLGLAQINSANLPRLGISIREAFDPCANLRGGATILSADYASATGQFGAGQYALRRAIGAYNTGSLYAGSAYIAQILEAAGLGADEDFVPDLERLGAPVSFLRDAIPERPAFVAAPYVPYVRKPTERRRPAAAPIVAAPIAAATGAPTDAFHSPILVTSGDGMGGPAQAPHPTGAAPPLAAATSPNAPVVLSADRTPIVSLTVGPPLVAASPLAVPGTPRIAAPPIVPSAPLPSPDPGR